MSIAAQPLIDASLANHFLVALRGHDNGGRSGAVALGVVFTLTEMETQGDSCDIAFLTGLF